MLHTTDFILQMFLSILLYILSCKTSASTYSTINVFIADNPFNFTLSKELMTIAPAFTIGLCGLSAQETRVCFHLLALTMRARHC